MAELFHTQSGCAQCLRYERGIILIPRAYVYRMGDLGGQMRRTNQFVTNSGKIRRNDQESEAWSLPETLSQAELV